jgi:hypothetical protein
MNNIEFYIFGHTRFLSPRRVVSPGLRQVQSIRDRQTRVVVGDRQRNCYLAIVLFAELSAILPRDAAQSKEAPCSLTAWHDVAAPQQHTFTVQPKSRNDAVAGARHNNPFRVAVR